MIIGERYGSANDAQQQLHNTYVEMNGDLCHLRQHEGWNFAVRSIKKKKGKRQWGIEDLVDIKLADLTLSPIPLGYINNALTTYYVQRKPLRKWKQGLYVEYLEFVREAAHTPKRLYARDKGYKATLDSLFKSDGLVDMYDNNYPSIEEVYLSIITGKHIAKAFHREWALRKENKGAPVHRPNVEESFKDTKVMVEYKGKDVGKIVGGDVILQHQFKYLSEAFVEAIVNAG